MTTQSRITSIVLAGCITAFTGSVLAAADGTTDSPPTGAVGRATSAVKGTDSSTSNGNSAGAEATTPAPAATHSGPATTAHADGKVLGKGSGPEKRDFKIISEKEAKKQGTLRNSGSGGNSSTGDSTGGAGSGAGNSGN